MRFTERILAYAPRAMLSTRAAEHIVRLSQIAYAKLSATLKNPTARRMDSAVNRAEILMISSTPTERNRFGVQIIETIRHSLYNVDAVAICDCMHHFEKEIHKTRRVQCVSLTSKESELYMHESWPR